MAWNTQEAVKRTKDVFAFVKDASTVSRDLLLLLLFLFLLFWPQRLNNILSRAGVTTINGGLFTWKQQVESSANQSKAAAQASSAAADSLADVKTALTAISSQSNDPKVKAQADAALHKVDGSLSSLQSADQSLTKALVAQENILQTTRPQQQSTVIVNPQGWVYLGEADANQQHWIVPPQPKVSASLPVPVNGQTITLTDDLYLRADKQPGQTFNQATISGAVRAGSTARIIDIQPSHALNGGVFLWAKIIVTDNITQ